jgi:hypothetical protein
MVLENMNLSENEIGRPPFWSNDLSSIGYISYQQSVFKLHADFIGTWTYSVRKLHALPFILCYELNVNLLISKGDG